MCVLSHAKLKGGTCEKKKNVTHRKALYKGLYNKQPKAFSPCKDLTLALLFRGSVNNNKKRNKLKMHNFSYLFAPRIAGDWLKLHFII